MVCLVNVNGPLSMTSTKDRLLQYYISHVPLPLGRAKEGIAPIIAPIVATLIPAVGAVSFLPDVRPGLAGAIARVGPGAADAEPVTTGMKKVALRLAPSRYTCRAASVFTIREEPPSRALVSCVMFDSTPTTWSHACKVRSLHRL
jgi:hypothetical protein